MNLARPWAATKRDRLIRMRVFVREVAADKCWYECKTALIRDRLLVEFKHASNNPVTQGVELHARELNVQPL
jgi:hypothetical protein